VVAAKRAHENLSKNHSYAFTEGKQESRSSGDKAIKNDNGEPVKQTPRVQPKNNIGGQSKRNKSINGSKGNKKGKNTPDVKIEIEKLEINLTKKGKQAIGTLDKLKDKPAREALKLRGGNKSATHRGSSDYWDMPLGEVANKAAQGDQQAEIVLKLIKQATKKAQKYNGK
jgi:hypothetical protein